MSDTSDSVAARVTDGYMVRSAADRVRMATSMFGDAKAIVRAGIMATYGPVPEPEMRRLLLGRLYGSDFSPAELADILRSIQSGAETPRLGRW